MQRRKKKKEPDGSDRTKKGRRQDGEGPKSTQGKKRREKRGDVDRMFMKNAHQKKREGAAVPGRNETARR